MLHCSAFYPYVRLTWPPDSMENRRKSITLSALGGTISLQSGLEVNGEILYYKAETQSAEQLQVRGGHVAWLEQKDIFFNMLTVEETLMLAAFLEIPQFTERQRRRRIRKTMDSLGLTRLKNRRIGDSALNHGLSGGEKRRLSLALELLSSPKLFIGDEPTSGLVSTPRKFSMKWCLECIHSSKCVRTRL